MLVNMQRKHEDEFADGEREGEGEVFIQDERNGWVQQFAISQVMESMGSIGYYLKGEVTYLIIAHAHEKCGDDEECRGREDVKVDSAERLRSSDVRNAHADAAPEDGDVQEHGHNLSVRVKVGKVLIVILEQNAADDDQGDG